MPVPDKYFDASSPIFPPFFQTALLSWLNQKGIDYNDILSNGNVTMAMLCDPKTRLSFDTIDNLVQSAQKHWGKPGLGLSFGSKLTLSNIGMVGQACASSQSNREACQIFHQYFNTRTMVMDMELRDTADSLTFLFDWRIPEARRNRYYLDVCLAAVVRYLNMLLNTNVTVEVSLEVGDGGYPDMYRTLFGDLVDFNQPQNSVTFFSETLDKLLRSSDPITFTQAKHRLHEEAHSTGTYFGIVETITNIVDREFRNPPSLVQMSSVLGMSERSLQRHLARKGLTYRNCVDGVLSKKARFYLTNPDMTISRVAQEMNYESAANFNRAFKRWFGMCPSQYREG